jgi:hypothetical protein
MSSSNSLIPSSAGGEKASARSSKCFLYVSKTLSRDQQDSVVSLKQFSFVTNGNSNKTQNITLTEAMPLR